jgi:hypothetical protein
LTDNLSDYYKEKIDVIGNFQIIQVENKVKNILRDRHLAFYNFLKDCKDDCVLITDSKDVYFQNNPFVFLENFKNLLILTTEGVKYEQSLWNIIDQFEFQKNVYDFKQGFSDWDVINGGIMAGKPSNLADFCLQIWLLMLKSFNCTDQAAINFICRHKNDIKLSNPQNEVLAITGETIKNKQIDINYYNGKVCLKDVPYCIFHQWNRTSFKHYILNH